jgi:hypothetical protein
MTLPHNKTKIACTRGPASQSRDVMEQLLLAGMNVARLNFSHGEFTGHQEVIANLRAAARATGRRRAFGRWTARSIRAAHFTVRHDIRARPASLGAAEEGAGRLKEGGRFVNRGPAIAEDAVKRGLKVSVIGVFNTIDNTISC